MKNELGRVYCFDPQVYPRKVWVAVRGDVGIVPDVNNQEPLAYLVGWITECIYKVKIGKV